MNFLKKILSKRTKEPPDIPPEFLQENAPDWLIALKGQEKSSGYSFSIRVQLFQRLRSGSAEILNLPREQSGQPETATTALARPEIDKLFVILGFSFPAEISTVPADAADSLPVTISIYRQQPFALQMVDCNLASWRDTKKSGPPAVEVGRILMEIHKRALSS